MADNKLISSVYDIPDALTENLPATTGPIRAGYNALRMPIDAGVDAASAGLHGALGLDESEPYSRTNATFERLKGALGDTAAPARALLRKGGEGMAAARDSLRSLLIDRGATPKAEQEPGSPVRDDYVGDLDTRQPPPGALTAPPRARARSRVESTRDDGGADETQAAAVPAGALNTQPGAEPDPTQAAQAGVLGGAQPGAQPAARQSLAQEFDKRIAAIEKDTGKKLTDQQKSEVQLDFFLRMMALGGRPGSRLLTNVGEAGLGAGGLQRDMLQKNVSEATERRKEAIDQAKSQVGFMDKEQDNARDMERLKIYSDQVSQGKFDVKVDGKNGTYIVIDKKTGATRQTGIKADTSGKDTRPAELQLLEHLKNHPEDLPTVLALRGKDKNDSDQIFDAATKRISGDVTGNVTPEQAVRDASETMRLTKGGASAIARPTTRAEFDKLPKGTQYLNPKDGKTYTKA